ncbi:MAG: S46 family peptidase [Acidobacteriota bacterium]
MKKFTIIAIILAFFVHAPAPRADEGMWTFDNPPLGRWKEKYNFTPSREWLDHVRLSSVRINDGGSGAFVSADGLVLTNQHVGASQLQKLSTAERDLVRDGFYARTMDEELKCPDMEINVLVAYEDVTARVKAAVKAGATDKEADIERKAEAARIEKESLQKTGLRSDVVTLYNGGEYWLYRYKKYTDVRLVFAVEEQIAFFGGDYDNFTFPRHDLDITFFRVYENGRPARVEHYLKWSAAGPSDGEFVIVSGHPGSTNRLLTLAQIEYQRDLGNPLQKHVWTARREALARYARTSAEAARRASGQIRSLDNSLKRLTGQQEGLMNPRIMKKKEQEEKDLRAKVVARADMQRAYGDAWDRIAAAYRDLPKMAPRIAFSTLAPSRLGQLAQNFILYAEETRKPNDQRYEGFRDSRLESLKAQMLSPAPVYSDMEESIITAWLEEAQKTLGASDPFVKAALAGSTPATVARDVIKGTRLIDATARKALFESGTDAILKSDDPLIALARRVVPVIRELRAWNDEKIKSVETAAGQKIAEARFAVYGKTAYPDATFTLRLGYGRALGYEEDTTLVPFKTTFYGLYDRALSFNEKPPYNLPARWKTGKDKLDLSTPLNFVYTCDTIGGNSGSPVINRQAELVGLNFDSNIQKLPNRYLYIDEEEGSRAVAIHSAAIIEALRKLYDAGKLVDEILKR